MPKRNSRIEGRWQEASDELASARTNTPEDTRFAWDKARAETNLPSYDDLLPSDEPDSQYIIRTAPTGNPSRPRARTIGYNPATSTVVIVFRDNTWWQYEGISPEVWMGLSTSSSTSAYLPKLESECLSHGPAKLESLSEGTKAQMTQNAQISSDIQTGDKVIEQASDGMLNLRSFSSEELFKD